MPAGSYDADIVSFHIRHRAAADAGTTKPDARALRWRTCLREITFIEGTPGAADADGALCGAEAYALLLETICGLQSPIAGETQVMGQFRAFLNSPDAAAASWLAALGDELIHDARRVRERHLRGVGSGGYGSEVRRLLQGCEVVAIIGRGALASELRPYLDDCGRVEEWTRPDLEGRARRGLTRGAAGLVVAAPVANAAIEYVMRHYPDLRHVVDLRAADERAPLPCVPVSTLDVIFGAARASAAVSARRVAAARTMIRDLACAFATRQQVRPFGWEDLCA